MLKKTKTTAKLGDEPNLQRIQIKWPQITIFVEGDGILIVNRKFGKEWSDNSKSDKKIGVGKVEVK